ncbi:IS30 family transposase [Nocardioides sp.]|uniref:IS30 family transposase n=1 Tax=Nocardioides sp. TaxID=35761 RepID=UPI0039C97FAF
MGRPPVPVHVQRVFWQQVAAGVSVVGAGAVAGISRPTAQRLFARAGGVVPSIVNQPQARDLTFQEREEIACLVAAGKSVRAIGRALGRDPGTISRELRRNAGSKGLYRASTAQQKADAAARRPKPAKLATNLRLRRQVQAWLGENHSPEQIAARLRHDFPDDPEMWVSHETIYQSLYVQGRGALRRELTTSLRTGRAMRRPRKQAQTRNSRRGGERIKDMVMISERPAEVEDRAVPGHWEGDLITGAENKSAIGTLVEPTTRFVILLHLPDIGPGSHGALAVQHAMLTAMADLPTFLRKSLTWDQGIEMANHAKITEATGLDIYFCDPASPWQRGTNENTNGLLRQYFPKSTDLSFHGPGMLERVAIEMNNRPRKTLGWKNPAEALDELLSQHDINPGVAPTG